MKTRLSHTAFSKILNLVFFPMVLLFLLALSPGCHSDKPAPGKAALSLRDALQAKLNLYSAALAEPMSQGDTKRVRATLESLFSEAESPAESIPILSIMVLDDHGAIVGAIVGTATPTNLSAIQNYGNYQVVSRVAQKRKAIQSSLYMQGGEKVFIVCAPLLHRGNLSGIIIFGLNNDHIHQAGITDGEFMSLAFTPHPGTP